MSAPIEHIKVWINKADLDLGSAKIIFLHLPDYFDTIAFHCQQAAGNPSYQKGSDCRCTSSARSVL